MKRIWSCVLLLLFAVNALAEAAPASPEVKLKGNPTTGYSWIFEVEAERQIIEVEGGYAAAESPYGLVGAGGEYCFVLRGMEAGDAIVRFDYARPWESAPALYTLTYHVRVDEQLNVTILRCGFDW